MRFQQEASGTFQPVDACAPTGMTDTVGAECARRLYVGVGTNVTGGQPTT
jgi:hypothetical protein